MLSRALDLELVLSEWSSAALTGHGTLRRRVRRVYQTTSLGLRGSDRTSSQTSIALIERRSCTAWRLSISIGRNYLFADASSGGECAARTRVL